jgi:peptidoglycan-associated lipoprotein
MNKIFWPVLLALTLSACSSTSDTQATVEDRTGGKTDATSAKPVGKAGGDTSKAASGGVETAALGGTGVSGSSLDGKQLDGGSGSGSFAGDPRKNPASPLSTRSIFFDYDSFVVKDEYRPMLEAHAAYLLSNRDARLILQGNTDERGSREYNLALGQKRAEAVRKALAVLGVNDAQIEAVSFGEEKLRVEADTEEAHGQNRRTDLVYGDE